MKCWGFLFVCLFVLEFSRIWGQGAKRFLCKKNINKDQEYLNNNKKKKKNHILMVNANDLKTTFLEYM